MLTEEDKYIRKRIWKAGFECILFYLCRIFPIKQRKIVFCTIEGTTGYTCNPKYIAEELIRQNKNIICSEQFELIWLVNDVTKHFPNEIKVIHNSLWNRAYQLSTAHFWIDNSRKQLEVRKRKGQIYIQTWHAKLGFKPTCLDRGESFSKIAYLVSEHDSNMIDYVLSNSRWYDQTLPTGMIYKGPVLRTGSPRCDILLSDKTGIRKKVRKDYSLPEGAKILMYAPTFRGGNQGTNRTIAVNQGFPDFRRLKENLEIRFCGEWFIFLRLHPQLAVRKVVFETADEIIVDISQVDDMYEVLAGCDVFMTDYSSAAFDAASMKIPVFLYADDYMEYEGERGKLLWDLRRLPFPLAIDDDELKTQIISFDDDLYQRELERLFLDTEMVEDGKASKKVVEKIKSLVAKL